MHDHTATNNARAVLGDAGIDYTDDLDLSLQGATAVVLLTAWPEY